MGEVFLAEDSRLKRKVALKSLSEAWARAPDARRRLLHEARAAAALNHPNIAAVYDVVEGEDTAYIVMEYVAGETLADRLRTEPLPSSAVAWIGRQLCDALAEAHAHGIIHRDLKPSNLLLTPDGRLKVLDFGISKTLVFESNDASGPESSPSDAPDLSRAGRSLVGTPPYLPPEHLLRRPVDERSDIYTAGVVLYELLTGRRPFEGSTAAALAAAILHDTPRSIRSCSPSVPEPFERVVVKAMSRDPDGRYPSAAAMKADLERARGPDEETAAYVVPENLPRTRRRRRWALQFAGACLALIAVGSVTYRARGSLFRPTPAHVPVLAVLPFVDISGGGANDYLTLGIPDLLIASLASLPDVNVVSRAATFRNRETTRDIGRIARDAGADFVLDGAVQRAQDQVRVTLNLVQANSLVVVWSNSYDGLSSDSFGLQRRVAEAVATALPLRLAPGDRKKLHDVPSENQAALESYYHARAFLERHEIAGNADRAIELFQQAVAADPRFAMAHAGLGEAFWWKYEKTKDPEWTTKAQAATGRALELAPQLPGVRYSLAVLFRGTGRNQLAEEEVRRLVAEQPGHDDARRLLGKMLLEQGRSEEGLAELRQAVSLRPSWSNYYGLGVAYLDLARYSEAVTTYRRLAELQPDRASVFTMLGTAYHFAGNLEQAAANYRRSIELGATAGAWANLGTVYYADHRCEEARDAYEHALRLEAESASVLRNLGDAFACLGNLSEAAKVYAQAIGVAESVVKVNPSNALAWAKLAVYEAKAGRHAAADRSIARALVLNSSSAEILYWHAVVLALGGRAAEAVTTLRSALGRGYSPFLVRQDDDLASLRNRPDYQALFDETSVNQSGRKG